MFLDNPPLGIYEAKDHQQHQQQLTFQPLSLGGGGQEIVEYSSSPSESSSPGSRDLSYSASHTRNSSISLSSDRKEDVHKDMSYVEQFVEDMLVSLIQNSRFEEKRKSGKKGFCIILSRFAFLLFLFSIIVSPFFSSSQPPPLCVTAFFHSSLTGGVLQKLILQDYRPLDGYTVEPTRLFKSLQPSRHPTLRRKVNSARGTELYAVLIYA